MKKSLISILALLMLVSCQINELAPEYVHADDDLYASIEPVNATKTVMDENNNILWSEGDQLVAFMKTTLGLKYQIKEQYVGTSTGGFSKINEPGNEDDLESGQELDHNVVLYPHSTSVWCMKNDSNNPTQSYKLNVVLPETQVYEENSFGIGAFPMIAVSIDNKLTFRNICGGLKLQFKGVDKIKSIRLEGLGNEKISGKSTVVGYVNGIAPSITMADNDKSYTYVTLDCGEGVQLSETAPATFIIAVPPVEFASGMKITVTDTDGLSKTLTNSSANTIKRSCLTRFPVITYKQDGVLELPEGTLTSYEIPAEGGTVEIPLTTNREYEVVIPEDAQEWISLAQTKALREEVITLNILENTIEEVRSAEVLIAAAGETLRVITINQEAYVRIPQEGDYIDEYGVNHGQGVEIDGVVWAPVNCGYHKDDFKYGKLYQWGRKYGQGYNGKLYDVNGEEVGKYSDSIVPEFIDGPVSLSVAQSESNAGKFIDDTPRDWHILTYVDLWNAGTEDDPVKTEYDPCPDGWRVPTYAELVELSQNHSEWTTDTGGLAGYWFSGSLAYDEKVPQVFLSAAGSRDYLYGVADERGKKSFYWSCNMTDSYDNARCIYFSKGAVMTNLTTIRGEGKPVRCVKDEMELIPVDAIDLSCTTLDLWVGDSERLTANIIPASANHKTAIWWSDNPKVADVDSEGKVTAVAAGTATITAMAGMQAAICTVTVNDEPETCIDLSSSGTANSYIVSKSGTYKFSTVKGNSSESVGAVSSAEVLWETFGTDVTPNVGDLVKNVSYKNGEVTFQTADTFTRGNAVIAAKDADGNILWSWHIWLTDEPQGQVYYNNAGTMMDRNLGATSATPGDVGALGLLYQWGRKDPFLGSSSVSTSTVAVSTGNWPAAVYSNSYNGTIGYAVANPMTFIAYNSYNDDWYYTGTNTTDNTRWSVGSGKSVYDPCPSGWRVPDYSVWSEIVDSSDITPEYDSTNGGFNFSGFFGSASTIWYPASGYRHTDGGELYSAGTYGYYWSSSPNSYLAYSLRFSKNGILDPSIYEYRTTGRSVRCIKE